MFSEIPVNLKIVAEKDLDKEIMRAAMIAELDAVNLYESMASLTESEDLKAILMDVAREEKVHVAMFQTVLMEVDKEYLKVMSEYSLGRGRV
ncbi:ferritin family protein [Methanolobus halotolerans]|uniref:Rubrerythrin n=1 Tax=Methanolobus halotolerans TaxID=2052935 RepID=A0A4E0Q3S3_9EURY|nr:demethoxyubiquinone hydroxylase family protein [Methanolobus halotolerans]TGC08158.1 rubrerythrin [Methanolobus halotolerans]